MTSPQQWENLSGLPVVDPDGDKIGKVGQVYLDDATGQPSWVTVNTGLFGTRESFAPLYGSSFSGDQLVLAVAKQLVNDAPSVDDSGHIEESEIDALYQHYAGHLGADAGTTGQAIDSDTGYDAGKDTRAGTAEGDVPDRVQAHDTDGAITRSEEQLRVGTENVATGRARLRKYVVTENVTTSVPVSHEEVRLEREPITEANRDDALDGPDISEEEHEVVLHAERPVVAKETVPVERVRVATETVTEDHEVNEQVRKEQIDDLDVEHEADPTPRGSES